MEWLVWIGDDGQLPDGQLEQAMLLQGMVISVSQNDGFDQAVYHQLRVGFMKGESKALIPSFVKDCRDQEQLWSYCKKVASGTGSWEIRRHHIYDAFKPLLDFLEDNSGAPSDAGISASLSSFDPEGVHRVWERALSRRYEDAEGAITAARTLLETVCKRILDEVGESYSDEKLPKLYGLVAKAMNLSPSQHSEDVFKSILGGCYTVVNSLGTMRNKIGDAHGQGRNPIRPTARHAALAVNLAGAMATFLVETWLERNSKAQD